MRQFEYGTPVKGVTLMGTPHSGIWLEFSHTEDGHDYHHVCVADLGNVVHGHKCLRDVKIDREAADRMVLTLSEPWRGL